MSFIKKKQLLNMLAPVSCYEDLMKPTM